MVCPFVRIPTPGFSPSHSHISYTHHIMSSWADDIDGEEQPQTFTDAKGITTHIEYRINDDGKKVKVKKKRETHSSSRNRAQRASTAKDRTPGFAEQDTALMNRGAGKFEFMFGIITQKHTGGMNTLGQDRVHAFCRSSAASRIESNECAIDLQE